MIYPLITASTLAQQDAGEEEFEDGGTDFADDSMAEEPIFDNYHPQVSGYEWHPDGLYRVRLKKTDSGWERVGEHLLPFLYIVGIAHTASGRTPHLIIGWTDQKSRDLTALVPTTSLASPATCETNLASEGIKVFGEAKEVVRYLKQAQALLSHNFVLESNYGWFGHEPVFIWADGTVTGQTSNGEVVIPEKRRLPEKPVGTLEQQLELLQLLTGNAFLQFPTLIALAAPLGKLANCEGGGFNYVGDSSAGKSTSGRIALGTYYPCASLPTWNGTSNAFGGIALRYNCSFLMLDELAMASEKTIKETAFFLASGTERRRLNRDAHLREASGFNVSYFSTGECAADGVRRTLAGEDVRLCRIPVPDNLVSDRKQFPSDSAFVEHLNREAPLCWGHVGRRWIEYVVARLAEDRAALVAKIESYCQVFLDAISAKIAQRRQLGRVAHRFAMLYAAGRMASEAGIVPWDLDSITQATLLPFNAHADDTEGLEGEDRRVLDAVYTMCRTQPARFEFAGSHSVRDSVGHRLMRSKLQEGGDEVWDFYFSAPGLKATCQGSSNRQILPHLVQHGWLERDDSGRAKRVKMPNGEGGNQLFYRITAEVLDSYEDTQGA